MKRLYTDSANTIFLESPAITGDSFHITLSIIGEDGTALRDSDNAEISGWKNTGGSPKVTWDGTANKYKATFSFKTGTARQYARAFWYAKTNPGNVDTTLAGFQPEDIELLQIAPATNALPQIMPVTMFVESWLRSQQMDSALKTSIAAYVSENRAFIESELIGAQGRLEDKLKIKLFKTVSNMDRDFYSQDLRNEFWMQQTDWRPVIELLSFKLVYGSDAQEYDITGDIKKLIVVDKKMGTLELLPNTSSGMFYAVFHTNLHGLGITLMTTGTSTRVPLLFRIEYSHGLDFPTLDPADKESIRNAIGRNAFIEFAPRVDPLFRITSKSLSIDGASKSQSGGGDAILKRYQEDEAGWVLNMQRRYGTAMDMVIV